MEHSDRKPYKLWSNFTVYSLDTADLIIVYIISREVSCDLWKLPIGPISDDEVLQQLVKMQASERY